MERRAQGDFEFADVGPSEREATPSVRFKMPGRLLKRSEYENVAPGINPEAERGIAREPEEKVSDFDDSLFSGDPTRLMPHLRAIHKMGEATPGTIGIEDIDAVHQSPGTVRPRQVQRVMSDLPAEPGPGYEADSSTVGAAPGEPEGDGHGDIPIEEPTGQTSSKEISRRSVGKTKHAEPPPPPGMSAARWDKILEAGPKQGEETLPPSLTEMEAKKPVIETTDLIQRLEKRGYKPQGQIAGANKLRRAVVGGLIGGTTGAAAGALLGAATGANKLRRAVVGSLIGGTIGAGLGQIGPRVLGKGNEEVEYRGPLYHLTPTKNLKRIEHNGLRARTSRWGEAPRRGPGQVGSGGNRVYFTTTPQSTLGMLDTLADEDTRLGRRANPDRYALVEVDPNVAKERNPAFRLFVDPEWPEHSVYSKGRVLPQAVVRSAIVGNRRDLGRVLAKQGAVQDSLPPFFDEKRGHKLQGQTEVQGLPIAIENKAGSIRRGTDKDGHEWETKMQAPYGYLVGTKGADGEPVDCYVGPDKEAPNAFVVHQNKSDGTGYDEDKVILAVRNKAAAKKLYLDHYDDPKFLGPIAKVSVERLKELVASKKQLVKISRASWAALLQEMQKLGAAAQLAPQNSQEPRGARLMELVRKAGPGVGGALGAGAGALVGLKRGKLLSSTLAGMGTGATLGWAPDLYMSAREGIQKYRSGQ